MTLEQYWTILIKRWKFVLICFLFVGAGAFIGSKLMKPLYQSSVLVQVVISSNNNLANYDNLLASEQLVQTEADLVTSNPILREVAPHYPGLTASQLAQEVSSSPKTSTQLFEIDVVDPSPARAADLANDIAATLIKHQQQTMQKNNTQSQQQIQENIDLTSQQIDDITTKISVLHAQGGNQGQIATLQAQLSEVQQLFSQWHIALAQLEQTQAQSVNFLQVVQPGQPASDPVRPNILLNTGGGFLTGLLLGMFLIVLFEKLDTRVRTTEALSELLNLSTLAVVQLTKSSNKEEVINPKGRDINVESYRILRTNIGFASIDKPLHSLVVTSALPRDGKSAIAANLAIFMAKAGKQTLLIDADLHRPTQHTLFGLAADKMGLTNAILAFSMPGVPNTPTYHMPSVPNTPTYRMPSIPKTPTFHRPLAPISQGLDALTTTNPSLEPFVHAVDTPNLWVMPTGPLPPNPSELLASKTMQRFLAVIENCGVEVVIFDTPPLLGLSDTSILASKVDGVLAVIDMTRATKGKLKQLKAVLTQTGANVLGCVANKQQRSRDNSAYSYYYYQTEEQNGSEKQASNGQVSSLPGTQLSPLSPSPLEQGKKPN